MNNSLLIETLEDLEKSPYDFDIDSLDGNDWYHISMVSELSESFIRKYHDKLDWSELIKTGSLNESLIREFNHYITVKNDWEMIAMHYEDLSQDFLSEYLNRFSPDTLLEYQKVSAKLLYSILKKHKDASLAKKSLEEQVITPHKLKVIEKVGMGDVISWHHISKEGKLSKKSIETFKDNLQWQIISKHRELHEKTLIKYKDYLSWDIVSLHQNLSTNVILKFPDKIHIENLKKNKKVNHKELENEGIYEMLTLLQSK